MRQLNAPFDYPPSDPNAIPMSDAHRIIAVARSLANGGSPGVFTTVDEDGIPRSRWMTALTLEDFPILYALTSPTSRKIQHLKGNPRASWMFADETLDIIINLMGRARIVSGVDEIKRAWRIVRNKSDTPLFKTGISGVGFAVIATEIVQVECTVPRSNYKKMGPLDTGLNS